MDLTLLWRLPESNRLPCYYPVRGKPLPPVVHLSIPDQCTGYSTLNSNSSLPSERVVRLLQRSLFVLAFLVGVFDELIERRHIGNAS